MRAFRAQEHRIKRIPIPQYLIRAEFVIKRLVNNIANVRMCVHT